MGFSPTVRAEKRPLSRAPSERFNRRSATACSPFLFVGGSPRRPSNVPLGRRLSADLFHSLSDALIAPEKLSGYLLRWRSEDGKGDVAYGPYWWAEPDFKKRVTFYPDAKKSKSKNAAGAEVEFPGFKGALGNENDYSDNFIVGARDFNGDGKPDVLVGNKKGAFVFLRK